MSDIRSVRFRKGVVALSTKKNSTSDAVRFSELQYYFDAQQRDFLDRGAMGRKAGEFLALRDKLLALPDQDFEVAMKTLRNLITTFEAQKGPAKPERATTRDTLELQKKPSQNGH